LFDGVISGGGGIAVVGAGGTTGTLTLGGVNTYTGTTSITDATVALSGSGSIASSSSVTLTSDGVLDISGLTAGTTIQDLSGDSTSSIVLGANTLTDDNSGGQTFAGVVSGTGGFSVGGSGTLTLSGVNTYSGTTTVDSGVTLSLGTAGTLADSAVAVNGTLDVSSDSAAEVGGLSGSGTVTLGANTLQLNNAAATSNDFSGVIGGTGGLKLIGTGIQILSGTNTYTGATKVTLGGTLQLGDGGTTGSVASTAAITLDTGSTLAFDHASTSSFTVANAIGDDGSGIILQEGGTTVLTGVNSGFTGTVTISGGTLEVDSALGATTTTVSGGTLQGIGTIAGDVNVDSGGTLAAGTASTPGILTIHGTLTLASGSTVVLREDAGTSDSIVATSATIGTGSTLDFALTGATSLLGADALDGGISASQSFSYVVLSGTGDLTLNGSNDFAGLLAIDSGATLTLAAGGSISSASSVAVNGTLDITAASQVLHDLSGSGSILLGATKTLTVDNTGTNTFSGSLTGASGSLIVEGTGTFVLSGSGNAYTGTTTVGSGTDTATLQIGNGSASGSLGTGGVTVNAGATLAFDGNASSPLTVANSIAGSGTLTQESGVTALTGSSTFAGTVSVTGGTLEVNGTLGAAGTAVAVTGGTLQGSGILTAGSGVTIDSGGTLGAGTTSTPGTLAIVGNLTMASGSSAVFRDTSAGLDQVNVTGSANVSGSTATFYVTAPSVRPGVPVTVMDTTAGGSGTMIVNNALANALGFTSSWTGNDLVFTAYEKPFTGWTTTGNQTAVAANLDSIVNTLVANGGGTYSAGATGAKVVDYLNTLSGSQLGAAMNQITPTSMASMGAVVQASSDNVGEALSARMSALRAGSTGLSVQNLNLGPNTDYNSVNLLADNSDTAPIGYNPLPFNFLASTPDNRWGTFISGLGTSGQVNDNSSAPGYDYYSGGFQAGIDYRLFPSLTVGLAGGYQHGQADFNQSSSTIATDTANLQLYSTWHDQSGDWVAGNLGGAYDWFDSKRDSLDSAVDGMAEAKPHGTEINSMLQGGRDFTRNNWTMTPSLGLLYNRTMLGGYTESGSLTPLTVDSHDLDSLRTRLGFRLANRFTVGAAAIPLQPYVEAGWQHEYLDQDQAFTARFASGAGGLFSVTGRDVGSDSATFGFGISALFTPSITAAISYFGQGNDDYLENDIEGTLRYMF